MIVALLVSTGAAWESAALAALQAHREIVVLKRCVDVADLLATASTGQAEVAVLATDLPGLDLTVLDALAAYEVAVVGISEEPGQVIRPSPGIGAVLGADDLGALAEVVRTLPAGQPPPRVAGSSGVPTAAVAADQQQGATGVSGRVLAVWGGAGAPGRSTVAAGLAGELARRGLDTVLIDADPLGGALAQQLGLLEETSGLLAAARAVSAGTAAERLPGIERRLSEHLRILTGLPRADRWSEIRPGTLSALVGHARARAQVVIDTGCCLESDLGEETGRPGRHDLTREAIEGADDVILVGGADPVALARLARAGSDLRRFRPEGRVHVLVNRMRPSLGWRESEVARMLAGLWGPVPVHFLPADQAAVARAVVAGRLLVESGDSALSRSIASVVGALAAGDPAGPAGPVGSVDPR